LWDFGRAQNFLAARLLSRKKIPNDRSGIMIDATMDGNSPGTI